MQLGNKSIHREREVILEDKVKMKLPQKIKLDFSSKNQNWIAMAQAKLTDKFLKFSTKNDHSFNISKVIPIYYVHYMLVISYALL